MAAPVQDTIADRVEREREWHDKRFGGNDASRGRVAAFTGSLTLEALRRVYAAAKPLCLGKNVLDYGCSFGEASLLFRSYGAATVEGIDISPVAVQGATEAAAKAGVTGVNFQAMNAEVLEFPDASFELVFGVAILHHLDLDRACAEIARVLKPSGAAVFLEPLGHNPVINYVRRATPNERTEDEHPLLWRDFAVLDRHFGVVDKNFVNLLTLLTAPLVGIPGRESLRRGLNVADRVLLRAVPAVGTYAWNVVLTMKNPRPRVASTV